MISKRKVVLVGTGFVGMSMAYALENGFMPWNSNVTRKNGYKIRKL